MVKARESLAKRLTDNETTGNLSLDDELAIVDRLLKINAHENRLAKGKAGSAFDDDEEETDD